jgi:hypothetical protein
MSVSCGYTIGIGGQARSGKDTLGAYLVQRLNGIGNLGKWERRGFADPVKRIFMEVFGVHEDFVESWKTRAEPPAGFQMSVRSCLTLIGDGFRQMKPTVWIDKLFRSSTSNLVVPDVRYINEVQCIRQRPGVVILLFRPGFANNIPSPSEQELVPLIQRLLEVGMEGAIRGTEVPCDYFLINGGSVEDLYRKADECILPDLIRRVQAFLF